MASNVIKIETSRNRLEIEFYSISSCIDEIIKHVLEFCNSKLENVDEFSLKLILCEGLANAVIHGNNNDPTLTVILKLEITKNHIEIKIVDQGLGKTDKSIQPFCDDDALPTHGRGLPLMDEYCDEFSYDEKKHELTLKRNI